MDNERAHCCAVMVTAVENDDSLNQDPGAYRID
jgi:hypothetical protein